MTGVVMDASAIQAFLNGDAPELLARFEDGVTVSEVTLHTLEWHLIRTGGKRLEVRGDLERLGLDAVAFTERQLEGLNAVLNAVPGLEFEGAVAAGLARGKKARFITGNPRWQGVSISGLEVQLVSLARVVPAAKPVTPPIVASVDGGGS
jgi:hypothetical protein